jgi:cation diffusion facilitator family transporter
MHTHPHANWSHDHVFLGQGHLRNERRIWLVVALTAAMMVGEIIGGMIFGSMALVADGWHMATHAGALTISAVAYRFARRHAHDSKFSFGSGKFGELAGFSSALILALIAVQVAVQSFRRLANPVPIGFDEATAIAILGLAVNLVSAWLLRGGHGGHGGHEEGHQHHDHNLRAAYLHVIADSFTSVLAIVALLTGRFFGAVWMDPVMGIVGALVIGHWSVGLMRTSGKVLLDAAPDPQIVLAVRSRLESGSDRVSDLHLWSVGPGHLALVATVVTDNPLLPDQYKARLHGLETLSHVTIEVQPCVEGAARSSEPC